MRARHRITGLWMVAATISLLLAPTAVASSPAPTAPTAPTAPSVAAPGLVGTFYPGDGSRILDTRSANGVSTRTPIPAGQTVTLQVTGRGGVSSSGVGAVVLNLTVTGPAKAGYLTAWPAGQAMPATSSLNFLAGENRAALVTVPVSSTGKVSLRSTASTHLLANVQGYYFDGTVELDGDVTTYVPLTPRRVWDTRLTYSLAPRESRWVSVPNSAPDAFGMALNVTVVRPERYGFVGIGMSDGPSPSAVNFATGQTTSNMTILPSYTAAGQDQEFYAYNGSDGYTDVVVDLVGRYDWGTNGLRFHPATPTRIVDSRVPLGTTALGTKDTNVVQAPSSVANSRTRALVTTVTAVRPTTETYLTLWADGSARPGVSNLNPHAGQTVSTMAMVRLSSLRKFDVYNNAGSTQVVVDVTGRFDAS
ncbi:MAG: hypothetical protein JWP82_482 [Humibacillus sp.]|nr:hypothetical protein [Humibacillus sp.]